MEKFQIRGDSRPLTTYISGNPGKGKSTLMLNMALQDIEHGHGVCVMDPHRDLVFDLLQLIPASRKDDTIFFDSDNPIPIDLLSCTNYEKEIEVLIDQLTDIFALDDAPISKPRLQSILAAIITANKSIPCTFLDIKRFIENKSRRDEILRAAPRFVQDCPDEIFKKPAEWSSIIERLKPFTTFESLQKIVDCPRPPLNISNVMRTNKVLLMALNTNPTDYFIASIILSKFQQATFGRMYMPPSERTPFYLYVDECHRVMKYCADKIEDFLTGARKFKLCLTMGNQTPSDLPKAIREKLGLVYTKIHFTNEVGLAHMRSNEHDHGLITQSAPKRNAGYAEYIRTRTVDRFACSTTQKELQLEEDDPPTLRSERPSAGDPRKSRPV